MTAKDMFNAMTAIVELRRSNPRMTMNYIYDHLDIKRASLGVWCKRVFGVTVAVYVNSVLRGNPVKPLKQFDVKHYVELTPAGIAAILAVMYPHNSIKLKPADVAEVLYGAVSDTDMLCIELIARLDGQYTNSTLVYTNYVLRDPTLFRVVPHTTPGVLLGIQRRNLGLEY